MYFKVLRSLYAADGICFCNKTQLLPEIKFYMHETSDEFPDSVFIIVGTMWVKSASFPACHKPLLSSGSYKHIGVFNTKRL